MAAKKLTAINAYVPRGGSTLYGKLSGDKLSTTEGDNLFRVCDKVEEYRRLYEPHRLVLTIIPQSEWHSLRKIDYRTRLYCAYDDGSYHAYRVEDIRLDVLGGTTIQAVALSSDLFEQHPIFTLAPNENTTLVFPLSGKTVSSAISSFIFDANKGLDTSHWLADISALSSGIQNTEISLDGEFTTYGELIAYVCDEVGIEWYEVYDNSGNTVTIHFTESVGVSGSASTRPIHSPESTGEGNRVSLSLQSKPDDFFTRVVPYAGPTEERVSIAGAKHPITSAVFGSGDTVITLDDGVIYVDDVFIGDVAKVYHTGGSSYFPITDSSASADTITVTGDASGNTPTHVVFLTQTGKSLTTNNEGTEIAYLPLPSVESTYGIVSLPVEYSDISPYENLILTPDLSAGANNGNGNYVPTNHQLIDFETRASISTFYWSGNPLAGDSYIEVYDASQDVYNAGLTAGDGMFIENMNIATWFNDYMEVYSAPTHTSGITKIFVISPSITQDEITYTFLNKPTSPRLVYYAEPTTSVVTDDYRTSHGGQALKVVCGKNGGIRTDNISFTGGSLPYLSAWAAASLEAGGARLELVDSNGKIFPYGQRADLTQDVTRSISFYGADPADGNVYLRLIATEDNTTFYLDAWDLTQSPTDWEYRERMGKVDLWKHAASELVAYGGDAEPTISGVYFEKDAFDTGFDEIEYGDTVEIRDLWDGSQWHISYDRRVLEVYTEWDRVTGAFERRVRLQDRSDVVDRFSGKKATAKIAPVDPAVKTNPIYMPFLDADETEGQAGVSMLFVGPDGELKMFKGTGGPYRVSSLTSDMNPIENHLIRPEQFGAEGDGVTDDGDALNQAWDLHLSTGKCLYFTSGKDYYTTQGLTATTASADFNLNVYFETGAKITFDPASAGTKLFPIQYFQYGTIYNPWIEGTGSFPDYKTQVTYKGHAFWLGNGDPTDAAAGRRLKIVNPRIRLLESGITIEQAWIVDIVSPLLNNCDVGLHLYWNGTDNGGQFNGISVFGGAMEGNQLYGLLAQARSCSNLNLYGPVIEGNGLAVGGWHEPSVWTSGYDYELTYGEEAAYNVFYTGNRWVVHLDSDGVYRYYKCILAHTSDAVVTEPESGSSWATYWSGPGNPYGVDEALPTGADIKIDGRIWVCALRDTYTEKGSRHCPHVLIGMDDSVVTAGSGVNLIHRCNVDCSSYAGIRPNMGLWINNVNHLKVIQPAKQYFGIQVYCGDNVGVAEIDPVNVMTEAPGFDIRNDTVRFESPRRQAPFVAAYSNLARIDTSVFPITTAGEGIDLDPIPVIRLEKGGTQGEVAIDTSDYVTGRHSIKVGGSASTSLPTFDLKIQHWGDENWLTNVVLDSGTNWIGVQTRCKGTTTQTWIYSQILVQWYKDVTGTPTLQNTYVSTRGYPGYYYGPDVVTGENWVTHWQIETLRIPLEDILTDPDFIRLEQIRISYRPRSTYPVESDNYFYIDEVAVFTTEHGPLNIAQDFHDQNRPLIFEPVVSVPDFLRTDNAYSNTGVVANTFTNRPRELLGMGWTHWDAGTLPYSTTVTSDGPEVRNSFYWYGGADQMDTVLAVGPNGNTIAVLESESDGSSTACGGFYTPAMPVDHTRGFFLSCLVRATALRETGTTYFGVSSPQGNLDNAQTGASDSTSYLWTGDLPEDDEWFLYKGYIHGSAEPNVDIETLKNIGIYKVSTGERVANLLKTPRMTTDTTHLRFVSLVFDAGSTTGIKRQWAKPSIVEDTGELPFDQFFTFGTSDEGSALSISPGVLITNGDGSHGDTTNWSAWLSNNHVAFDNTRSRSGSDSGAGVFISDRYLASAANTPVGTNQFIPVSANHQYLLSCYYAAFGTDTSHIYFGFACYDKTGNKIEVHQEGDQGTVYGTLSTDASPGDTSIILNDTTSWASGASTGYFSAFPYMGYPVGWYTRRNFAIDWANSLGVGTGASDEITFTSAAGGLSESISAGTAVTLSANITTAGQTAITLGSAGYTVGSILHFQNGATWERMRILSDDGGGDYTVERGVEGSTAQSSWSTGSADVKIGADLIMLSFAAATYSYIVANDAIAEADGWQYAEQLIDKGYNRTLTANGFRRATVYIRPMFLPNFNDAAAAEGEHIVGWTDVDIREVSTSLVNQGETLADNSGGAAAGTDAAIIDEINAWRAQVNDVLQGLGAAS